jgi:hypothetical protein
MLPGFGWLKGLLGIVSTIFVGGFVAYQYFDAKWKARIERSLEYSILYQAPEKIAARNAATLWPPPASAAAFSGFDPEFVAKITEVLPQLAEQSIAPSQLATRSIAPSQLAERSIAPFFAEIDPDLMARSREIIATLIANRLAERIVHDVTKNFKWPALPSGLECEQVVDSYVEQQLDDGEYKNWKQDILTENGLVTEWGTLIEVDGKRYYSGNDGAYYSYTWPYLLNQFFYESSTDTSPNVCVQVIEDYESALLLMSPNILDSLHELKHFYAAVSICTTSGLCDSLVACEVFNGDVNNFVTRWQKYMELWSAQEREVEYWRLQSFISHCFSNPLFPEYSEKKLSWYYGAPMFYLKNFTNFW